MYIPIAQGFGGKTTLAKSLNHSDVAGKLYYSTVYAPDSHNLAELLIHEGYDNDCILFDSGWREDCDTTLQGSPCEGGTWKLKRCPKFLEKEEVLTFFINDLKAVEISDVIIRRLFNGNFFTKSTVSFTDARLVKRPRTYEGSVVKYYLVNIYGVSLVVGIASVHTDDGRDMLILPFGAFDMTCIDRIIKQPLCKTICLEGFSSTPTQWVMNDKPSVIMPTVRAQLFNDCYVSICQRIDPMQLVLDDTIESIAAFRTYLYSKEGRKGTGKITQSVDATLFDKLISEINKNSDFILKVLAKPEFGEFDFGKDSAKAFANFLSVIIRDRNALTKQDTLRPCIKENHVVLLDDNLVSYVCEVIPMYLWTKCAPNALVWFDSIIPLINADLGGGLRSGALSQGLMTLLSQTLTSNIAGFYAYDNDKDPIKTRDMTAYVSGPIRFGKVHNREMDTDFISFPVQLTNRLTERGVLHTVATVLSVPTPKTTVSVLLYIDPPYYGKRHIWMRFFGPQCAEVCTQAHFVQQLHSLAFDIDRQDKSQRVRIKLEELDFDNISVDEKAPQWVKDLMPSVKKVYSDFIDSQLD